MQLVNYAVEGGVAILTMDHPPTNALTAALRAQLLDALQTALNDPMVGAIALIGAGDVFSGGRDYSELGKTIATPSLSDLCLALEDSSKPVVAGLSGVVLGGGLELALACHYRVAGAATKVAMPEVALGAVPGAGGTQRAPRLVGADTTLKLFLSGALMPVTSPALGALVDEVTPDDVAEAAVLYALRCIATYKPPRPTREVTTGFQDFAAHSAAIEAWDTRLPQAGQEAARAIVDCVRVAPVLPFDVGLTFERDRFEDLITGDQFKALQHVALAERRASRIPEGRTAQVRDVKVLGLVVGANRLGADLAFAAVRKGMEVVISAQSSAVLDTVGKRIAAAMARLSSQGRNGRAQAEAAQQKLSFDSDFVGLRAADLVIETCGQGREVSRQIMAQLDGIVEDGTVMAVHDPSAPLDTVGQATGMPQDVIGLYVPNIQMRTMGCEIYVGAATSANAVATCFATMTKLGFMPVRSEAHDGGVGQSIVGACVRAAEDLLRLGADPYAIDRVMRQWGMTMGPFQWADSIGLNAPGLRGAQARFSHVLYKLEREGRSFGRGWYRYDADHPLGQEDAETLEVVRAVIQEDPQPVAKVGAADAKVAESCLAAMANAGARLLQSGVVAKPSDIDVVMIHGFGFPRWRGGPMQAADAHGLTLLRKHMQEMAAGGAVHWKPEGLIDRLIKNGRGFGALNS